MSVRRTKSGSSAGAHRVVWELHYERPRVIGYSIGSILEEDTQLEPLARQVLAGVYDVSLSVGGKTLRVPLRVRTNPHVDPLPRRSNRQQRSRESLVPRLIALTWATVSGNRYPGSSTSWPRRRILPRRTAPDP